MRRQIKLYIFIWLISVAIKFLPKDAKDTWEWLSKLPYEK